MMINDVLHAISRMNSGELAEVEVTVYVRRQMLGRGLRSAPGGLAATDSRNPAAYRIGDVVQMNSRIRPTYLRYLSVTIIAINRTTVSVCCPVDPRYGRFSGCPRVRLPIRLIAGRVQRNTVPVPSSNRGEDDGLGDERQALAIEGGQR